jgi:hypothetical protein
MDAWKRGLDWKSFQELVDMIQRDALEDPMASPTDQQELEMAKSAADQLHDQLMKMREKWLEARKHLRAANKGAERNAVALNLAVSRACRSVASGRQQKEAEERKHETIVWNWLLMSDDEYRLKCGELSAQDLRNIRAVLKAMLGTRILKL